MHRDIKPDNIMLGPYGETLVVDWGLAKDLRAPEGESARAPEAAAAADSGAPTLARSDSPTRTGVVIGTPSYMSPEQAEGRWDLMGPASDVYSLGVTLYTLLTGESPFQGREVVEVLDKVQRGEFLPPRRRKKDVPRALEAICLKAMARRPEERYGSPLQMAGDLEHWLADEPGIAWREPLLMQARRWLRRHRLFVLEATLGMLLIVTVLSVNAELIMPGRWFTLSTLVALLVLVLAAALVTGKLRSAQIARLLMAQERDTAKEVRDLMALMLRQSLAHGYTAASQLFDDKDLATFRSSKQFVKLIADLEKWKGP